MLFLESSGPTRNLVGDFFSKHCGMYGKNQNFTRLLLSLQYMLSTPLTKILHSIKT
jgi:hypothetical protein